MSFRITYPKGATPLDPNELSGLIPSYISTQGELNAAEQEGILAADAWATGRSHPNMLSESFTKNLHKRMFRLVWKWAGQYRTSDKSIGVHWPMVTTEVTKLIQDTAYWIENKTYDWDELGCRFHHRLVSIHPFPNGNGRHARLLTDALLLTHGQERFTWGGSQDLGTNGDARKLYIEALQAADRRKLGLLKAFVRS